MVKDSYKGEINITFDKECEIFDPLTISIDVLVCGKEVLTASPGAISFNDTT